jgi:hypothetical protein
MKIDKEPLDEYERYELELHKRMGADKYSFDYYLDNVLKRREDEMVQAAANVDMHPKAMVSKVLNV